VMYIADTQICAQSEIMRGRIVCNPTFQTTGLHAIQHFARPDCVLISSGKHAHESVFVNLFANTVSTCQYYHSFVCYKPKVLVVVVIDVICM
jgi:hypothetical protein